jgi:hypothetical protein
MMALFQAYGREKNLAIPSLQALKSQPRAIAQIPLHALSPDPFEEMVELTHEDDTFAEVQEIKEVFRKVVYMEHWTPQQVERGRALANEVLAVLLEENDRVQPRRTQLRF